MIRFELTEEEQQVLCEVVEYDLTDLRVEIVSTDRLEFKEALKHRKAILQHILDALQHAEQVPQAV